MTPVNICTFNAPVNALSDQIYFLLALLRSRGFSVSISDRLRVDALNLIIEDTRPSGEGCGHSEALGRFCRRFGKQVGIVMTEHIERSGGRITFDGAQLSDRSYISNRSSRFFGLIEQSQHAYAFFTLGPLPELRTFDQIFLCHSLYRLPCPPIGPSDEGEVGTATEADTYDAVFTGGMTPHREAVLSDLSRRHRVLISRQVDEVERAALYRRARVALNIPQTPTWGWVSPMRVMFGLRMARPTVHVGGAIAPSEFDRHVPLTEALSEAVAHPERLLALQQAGYEQLVRQSSAQFPSSVFALWARRENLDAGGAGIG